LCDPFLRQFSEAFVSGQFLLDLPRVTETHEGSRAPTEMAIIYDTANLRHILRPTKATLERIRRIDDAVAVAGSGEELPR
jgi:hypothetical protein